MYAVIETGGKQYRVAPGDEIKFEKLPGKPGEPVTFEKILLTSEDNNVRIGKPYLNDSKVSGRISAQDKSRKILVVKFKRRKGYRRKKGHRQPFTLVKIDNIETAS